MHIFSLNPCNSEVKLLNNPVEKTHSLQVSTKCISFSNFPSQIFCVCVYAVDYKVHSCCKIAWQNAPSSFFLWNSNLSLKNINFTRKILSMVKDKGWEIFSTALNNSRLYKIYWNRQRTFQNQRAAWFGKKVKLFLK